MTDNNLDNTNLDERKCPECGLIFKPKVYWQKFCCARHADKDRQVRKRARVKQALLLLHEAERQQAPSCCGGVGCNSCEPQGRG